MKKNLDGQTINFAAIVRADGTDGTGVTPAVTVEKDNGGPIGGAGSLTQIAAGNYRYEPTQEETNASHVVFVFKEATLITQVVNVYPIDVAEYQADVSGLSTFDHTTDQVITDAASREASKADVSGLSTFDPATDAVANVTTVGTVTGDVTTDTSSREASKADVSGLASQAELDKVPKKNVAHRYTNTGGGAGYDDVTISDAP